MLIDIGIGLGRRHTQTGHLPDQMLIEQPKLGPTKEGLVIETGRNEGRNQAVEAAQIKAKAGPTVLALALQTVIDKDIGRTAIGLIAPA